MNDRPVVVTGGAQGIGLAYARGFAERGHPVAICDVDPTVVDVAERERAVHPMFLGVVMDVSDEASVDAGIAAVEAGLGVPYVLINNAALFVSLPFVSWHEIDVATWDRVMAVNLRGPFLCARRVLPGMERRGGGRIINISSTTAHVGGYQRLHYASAKAGVIGLTRALAREAGRLNVTVNSIAPGNTQSEGVKGLYPESVLQSAIDMRCIARAEVPEDLVGAALFLASDEAAFMTGQTLVVDGGHVFL